MNRAARFFGLVILGAAVIVGVGTSQEGKKDDKTKKIKGQIPAGWKSLKLTKEQTDKVHALDVEYKTKIADLTAKIEELKQQSRIEMTKVLNDEQKALLAKLAGLESKEKDKVKDNKDKTTKDK
jgi:TolA-binding protein